MAVAGLLVLLVRAPVPPTGLEAAGGRRVFGGERVAAIMMRWGDRELHASRDGSGWAIDGRAVPSATATALDDLLATLGRLRAVDVFRPHDAGAYGLDRPRGTIELQGGAHVRRLTIGALNTAGSAFYARREGDGRILQVGSGIDSEIERVFYAVDHQSL